MRTSFVLVFKDNADEYRIVMTDAEAEHLRRKGVEAMTLYAFLRKGVELYSDRTQIDYRKERLLLSCVIAEHGEVISPLSAQSLLSIMRELEKEEKEIPPLNGKLEELESIRKEHRKALGDLLSINDVWDEAERLLRQGRWFRVRTLYVDNYPNIGRKEKEILKLLSERCNVVYLEPKRGEPEVAYEFPIIEEEVIGIARQILEINDFESCAVILAKPDEYLPIVKSIFDEYSIPYDCEIDERLIKTKTFEFVIDLIDLVEHDFRPSDIRKLLNSPLVEYRGLTRYDLINVEKFLDNTRGGELNEKAEAYIEYLKSKREEKFDENTAERIRSSARKLTECMEYIKSTIDLRDDPSDLLSNLFSLLSAFSLSRNIFRGLSIEGNERSVRLESIAFRTLIDILRDLSWACERVEMNAKDVLRVLRAELTHAIFKDSGCGVLIMGDEDALFLDLPHRFYCGLSLDSFMPARNPLLTDEECRKIGILEKRDYTERRNIAIRSSICGAVVSMVHTDNFNALKALGLSRELSAYEPKKAFSLQDLERLSVRHPSLLSLAGEDYLRSISKKRDLLTSREEKEKRFNEYNGVLGTSVPFDSAAPRKLEDYIRCPLHFFARYVLGLQTLKYEETEGMEWGTLVHSVLRDFYLINGEIDHGLVRLRGSDAFLDAGREKISRILQKREPQVRDTALRARVERAKRISFESFIRTENTFVSEPIYIERELQKETSVLRLSGIVDRCDITENGYVVFDYKTGIMKNKIDCLQIPLYLYMLGGTPANGFYYIITDRRDKKRKDKSLISVFENVSPSATIDEIVDVRLPAVVESIRRGYFPPSFVKDLSSDPCRQCDFKLACDGAFEHGIGPFAEYYENAKGQGAEP